jgi:hypothetical protein
MAQKQQQDQTCATPATVERDDTQLEKAQGGIRDGTSHRAPPPKLGILDLSSNT